MSDQNKEIKIPFFRISKNALNNGTCAFIGLFFLGIVISRSTLMAISYDEAYTFLNYARDPLGFTKIALANNHPLNTLGLFLNNIKLEESSRDPHRWR